MRCNQLQDEKTVSRACTATAAESFTSNTQIFVFLRGDGELEEGDTQRRWCRGKGNGRHLTAGGYLESRKSTGEKAGKEAGPDEANSTHASQQQVLVRRS